MVIQNPTLPAPQRPPKWNRNNMMVPFLGNEMQSLPVYWALDRIEWRHVNPFRARMMFNKFESTQTSANAVLLDPVTSIQYRMGVHDFAELMNTNWYAGRMTEEVMFTFKKVGKAYLLIPA